ncbi:MAG TPA: hypothetical protein VHZ76_08590 [Gammaproteobacteria bacterium]|jgi:TPR repeat protein|nr:hypothetical protein [Gammaproteobacteria bacterium]
MKKPTDAELQFSIGLYHLKKKDFKQAERWLRYANIQGHTQAQSYLGDGIQKKLFSSSSKHLHEFSIILLKQLITPCPTEEQINGLEEILCDYFYINYELTSRH